MKNKGKTKRLMWMTTAACAMMFLGMGVCLICGLRAARESIEESCKRDMEVVMEQLEKPYATRLNTSDELTETMERYLFSQGRREIDLAADGRFLSALNGKSVRDVLFVTTDGALCQRARANRMAEDGQGKQRQADGGKDGLRLSKLERRGGLFCREADRAVFRAGRAI